MRSEYKKLKTIFKKNLRVNSSEVELHKNLVTDLGLSDWEVEYLLAKIENEFNINLAYMNSSQNITVNNLLQNIQR
ncbi:MAG TPA: phosphopantetheine-binding protein [Chitinophagaceae bacterium]|nr:phosphopantetheine-binding protein [Chitinophagaceae bacterium]